MIDVIDSHTAGEPTRLVLAGGPDLGRGSLAQRAAIFQKQHDRFRSAVVNEPRGSDVLIGALQCEPADPTCSLGVLFFNNVGVLGMCGHGTIGMVATLAHLKKIQPGVHRIDTCVGPVAATLHDDGRISVENVRSYRKAKNVSAGGVTGDVAYGGNWFYLVADHGLDIELGNVENLTNAAWEIRRAINKTFAEVDHVELFGPPKTPQGSSRSFVLCPGKAYDRSPCGTGTSAKLACLAADDKLAPGETWVQESVIGTTFEASYQWADLPAIHPTITGRAYVTAESRLILDEHDPFAWGIRHS